MKTLSLSIKKEITVCCTLIFASSRKNRTVIVCIMEIDCNFGALKNTVASLSWHSAFREHSLWAKGLTAEATANRFNHTVAKENITLIFNFLHTFLFHFRNSLCIRSMQMKYMITLASRQCLATFLLKWSEIKEKRRRIAMPTKEKKGLKCVRQRAIFKWTIKHLR